MGEDALAKVGKGSAVVLAGFVLGTFFQYLYKAILARFLSPESFGVFTQGLAVAQTAAVISLLGLGTAIPRFMSYYRGRERNVDDRLVSTGLLLISATSLCATAAIFFSSQWVALNIFHEPALVTPLKIFAISILPLTFIEFTVDLFQGQQKALPKVILGDFIWSGSLPLLILVTVLLGYGLNQAVLSYLLATLISALVGYYMYRKRSDHGVSSQLLTRKLLLFGWPIFLISVFGIFNRWFDVLMLGWLSSSVKAGVYDISFSIAGYISFLIEVIGFMFMPVIAELYGKKDFIKIREIYTAATRWMITLSLPMLAGAIIFTDELIILLFGSDYLSGSTALIVLSTGFFYKVAKGPSEAILVSLGETKKYLLGAGVTTLIIGALNLFLIPKYGMLGAAASTLTAFVIGDSLLLLLTWQEVGKLPYNYRVARVIPPILISAGATYLIKISLSPGIIGSIFLAGFMGITYLTLLYVFKAIAEEDLSLAKEIYQRRI